VFEVSALSFAFDIDQPASKSYIGGLYMDQGLEVVKAWLDPLFQPYAHAGYCIIRAQHGLPPLPPTSYRSSIPEPPLSPLSLSILTSALPAPPTTTVGHLALFNQQLQKKKVEWIYSDAEHLGSKTTPVWLVKVLVDGEYFGTGLGNTKKAARNEAAKEGLGKLGIDVW
jgi:ribonuclease III